MSGLSQVTEGPTVADGTEQTLDFQGEGTFQLVLDTTNMVAGDTIVVRTYRQVLSDGGVVLVNKQVFSGLQSVPAKVIGPIALSSSGAGVTWTIEQTAGSFKSFDACTERF